MAQNFSNHTHGSPPSQSNQGFEDLMGSLRSPGLAGPAAPFQQGFTTAQWPMQWPQNASQGSFPFSMPHQMSPPTSMGWSQNHQDGYMSFDQEGDDEIFTPNEPSSFGYNSLQHSRANEGISGQTIQRSQNQQPFPTGPLPSLSSSSPLTLPPSQLGEGRTVGPAAETKSPMASNTATTARAAELRAKLLASKGSKSRQGSPAVRLNESGAAKKSQAPNILKQQRNSSSESKSNHEIIPQTNDKSNVQAPDSSAVTATTLETLMAEARDAADGHEAGTFTSNEKHAEGANGVKEVSVYPADDQQNDTAIHNQQPDIATHVQQPVLNRNRSVSELSEPGEIRSGASTPVSVALPIPQVKLPKKVLPDSQDKQEKLARQNEVKKTYQPLKKSKPQKPEPKALPAKPAPPTEPAIIPQQSRKPSFERRHSTLERPASLEESHREQHREHTIEHDHQEDRDLRRPSISQAYPNSHDPERHLAARRKRTDDNARRAAEYKKSLEAQGLQARQNLPDSDKSSQRTQRHESGVRKPLQDPSPSVSRSASTLSNGAEKSGPQLREQTNGHQDPDTMMISPHPRTTEGNDDINDWLELTDFYDEAYRERRLKLFRKRRALEIERAELEREEELEIQERVQRARAPSVLPTVTPSSNARRMPQVNVRMPPPPLPLPLRESNKDNGMKIKDAALSSGLTASQNPSPTLKRHYAEDSTETSPTNVTDKRMRLDTNGLSFDDKPLMSPASVKGDRPSAKGDAPLLENRISRYDSWAPALRPRSRSPEHRRRSSSPRGRRDYSPPPARYRPREFSTGSKRFEDKTCFNCGERGHMLSHCPLLRRDGKDSTNSRGYERWVSPNYRGKNPITKPALPQANAKSRMNSTGKAEQENENGGGTVH